MRILIIVVVALASALSSSAGVCRIGTTEYDSLLAAFAASANKAATIVLEQDIDVTEELKVPSSGGKAWVVDGDGKYAIRQAYAGRVFGVAAATAEINLTFRNVTICGGGAACSTESDSTVGVLFHTRSTHSTLTFDTGCVISNFVAGAALIGPSDNYSNWSYNVRPGAVIAHNTMKSGGIFRMPCSSKRLTISGGEIFDNRSSGSTIAYLDSFQAGRKSDNPILVVSGGRIHDNACTGTMTGNALFYCDYGPQDIVVTGGEIYANSGMVFRISRGGSYLSRAHFSGGKVYGNVGPAVYDAQQDSDCTMYLSGDAILAGNGGSSTIYGGLFECKEYTKTKRTVLEGDYTGYAQLFGQDDSSRHNNGSVFGTNLLAYAGAENIHLSNSDTRVLVTDEETGNMIWREPKSARIGTTDYDTLASALSAAKKNDTIVLLRDCVRNAPIVPQENTPITIDGNGHRIIRNACVHVAELRYDGGNVMFRNVQLDAGCYFSRAAWTNDITGVLVNTRADIRATVTLGEGTVLVGGTGTNALVNVSRLGTVNLDGVTIRGQSNRAVTVLAGGKVGVRGATVVTDNVAGDIDVPDASCFVQNGDLTGSVHVTVNGVEPFEGQVFGSTDGDYSGLDRFVNPGADRLHVSSEGGVLTWIRRGLLLLFK